MKSQTYLALALAVGIGWPLSYESGKRANARDAAKATPPPSTPRVHFRTPEIEWHREPEKQPKFIDL